MSRILTLFLALSASPALAAGGPFFSLRNSNFVVALAFIVFIGILLWAKVPGRLGALLDARATRIKAELDEARALRDEAKAVLATFEAKQKEVQAQSARIVASAREEAEAAAVQAKADLQKAIARRLVAAEEQIAAAEAGAIRQVREEAVALAVAAAADVLAKEASAESVSASIDAAIAEVDARLH